MAVIDLRLDEERFWQLTLREVDALLRRRGKLRAREVDFPTARILHLLANAWFRGKDDAELPFEKFLLNDALEEVDPERLKELAMDQLRGFVKMLGGDVTLEDK